MSEVLVTSGGTAPRESGDSITLKGLRIAAHHGVLAQERREGQPFVVDVTVWLDLSEAGEHDDLASTIDYGKLATEIHRRVSAEQWNLIERVAERVARLVLEDGRVTTVAVTVHKPRAPIEVEFEDVSVTVVRSSRGTRAAIALGTNLGDRAANLVKAVKGIRLLGRVVASSSVYETAPQGVVDQEPFYNAVVLVDTELDPVELMGRLLDIEREMGRVRGPRWGPRLIDLDLILYGDRTIRTPSAEVPHPRYRQRRFVLDPLVEVWPDARDPDGTRVVDLLEALSGQKVAPVTVPGWPHGGRR